ncbi:hypothetical protein M1N88_03840 [Dehalococcoidia bacterium]|nr:hypothetical protein [Dehalococcoidia bacterium]
MPVLGNVEVSGFYRVGSVTWWDFCPYTSQGPSVPDPLEVVIGVYCGGDFAPIFDSAAEAFEGLWPGTDVVITPFHPLDIETHMAHDLALGRIDLALSRTLVGESFAHYIIARGEVALIVNSRTAERLALGGAETFAISGEELRWIWERGADIVGTTWRMVDELDDRNDWCDTYDLNFVVPRARIIGSGNRAAFHDLVEYAGAVDEICADKEVATIDATGLPRLLTNGCMVMAIAANDFQIGYVPKGFIDDPEIQALKIGQRLPGEDGYPMVHVLFLVSN